jgi:hypothetical protein
MIRSGQMILANALFKINLKSGNDKKGFSEILMLFLDDAFSFKYTKENSYFSFLKRKEKDDNENIKDKNDIKILRKIFNNQIEEAEKYNCINFVALKSSKTDIYPTNEKISEFNINHEKFVNRKLSSKFNTFKANKRGKGGSGGAKGSGG